MITDKKKRGRIGKKQTNLTTGSSKLEAHSTPSVFNCNQSTVPIQLEAILPDYVFGISRFRERTDNIVKPGFHIIIYNIQRQASLRQKSFYLGNSRDSNDGVILLIETILNFSSDWRKKNASQSAYHTMKTSGRATRFFSHVLFSSWKKCKNPTVFATNTVRVIKRSVLR